MAEHDPFDADFLGGGDPRASAPATHSADPFDADFGADTDSPASTASGSFARGAVRGVLPAAGGLAGAGAGAAAGGAIGEAIFPAGGGVPGALIGGIVGGLGGGFGGGYAAERAQDYGLSKLPDTWVEAIGQDDRQQRLDAEQHPYASFLGGLAPFALTMKPGGFGRAAALPENSTAMQRLMSSPVTSRLFGGALMGGIELGQEAAEGNVDWNKVAISTGFGLVFNKPNRFGESIEGSIPRLFGRSGAHATTEPPAPGAPPPPEPPFEEQGQRFRGAQDYGMGDLYRGLTEQPLPPEHTLADVELNPTLMDAWAYGTAGPGRTEKTFLDEERTPAPVEQSAQAAQREEQATVGPPIVPDVNAIARATHPEAFERQEALTAQADVLRTLIDENPAAEEPKTHLAKVEKELAAATEEVSAARRRAAEKLGTPVVESPAPSEPKIAPSEFDAIVEAAKRELIEAGRPAAEAEMVGHLVATQAAVRAEAFNGAKGTALELYNREGVIFRGEGGKPTKVGGGLGPRTPAPASAVPTTPTAIPMGAARAKAESFGVANLIDQLGTQGVTPEEIASVISNKLSAVEIGSMLREGPRVRPIAAESRARDAARAARSPAQSENAKPAPEPAREAPTAEAAPAREPPKTLPADDMNTGGSAIGRFVDHMAFLPEGVPGASSIVLRSPEIADRVRAAAEPIRVETPNGATTTPDADHAALFEVGRRLASGDKMEGAADVRLLRRLLERFKGFVIEEPSYETHFETPHDVEALAADYFEHAAEQAARGLPAGDMLAADGARKEWAQRIIREIAESARASPLEPVNAAIRAREEIAAIPASEQKTALPAFTAKASDAIPADAEGRDQPAGVFMFNPLELGIDAKRFQFKSGDDEAGVTGALRSVKKWDRAKAQAIMVWEDLAGKLWVADGHQRAGLARRLTEENASKDISLPGILYREKDGISADDIRAVAAVTNIANGSGSAIDGAKVLRTRPDLLDGSVPLSAGKGQQAVALANLGDEAFRMVVNEVVPENFGAVVGQIIPRDHARQEAAIKALARFEPKNVEEATALTQRVAQAELAKQEEGRQGSLFGDLETPESTAGEEMKIVGRAIKELKKDKALFSRVVSNAGRIEKTGSHIEREAAQAEASDAETFAKVLASDAYSAGPVREALKVAAKELKDGRISITEAASQLHASLRGEVEANGIGGTGARGSTGEPEAAVENVQTEAGPEGTQQSLIPGVAPITNRERIQAAAEKPLRGGNDDLQHEGLFGDAKDQRELFQGEMGRYARPTAKRLRGIATLLQTADPTTAVHELGHDWLEALKRDAAHPEAPAQLRADWETTKRWAGIKDGVDIIADAPHERFANGLVRYLWEGVAPSTALARVFERFRTWFSAIYKTIEDLDRLPGRKSHNIALTPEMREVYGRLLSREKQTVIAPHEEPAPALHDIHTGEAANVPHEHASGAADRIEAERPHTDDPQPPREIANEIVQALNEIEAEAAAGPGGDAAGETGGSDAGLPKVDQGGEQAGPESAGVGMGGSGGPERESGNGPPAEVGKPTASGSAAGRPESSDPLRDAPLAPRPVRLIGDGESPYVDKAGNFKRANINVSDDVWAAIKARAEANNDFIGDRRAPSSWAQTQALATAMGKSGADQLVDGWVRGRAMNAEQIVALKELLEDQANEVGRISRLKDNSPEGVLAFATEQARLDMVLKSIMGATAEAGRALNIFRMMQGDIDQIMRAATGRTLYQKTMEMKLASAFTTPESIAYLTGTTTSHSYGRMILEYWINGLISGTATHTTYVIGNMILSMEKGLLETPMAAAIGATRAAMGRDTANVVRFGEAAARLRGAASGYMPAVAASAEAFRTGLTGRLPGQDKVRALPFQPEGAPLIAGPMLNEAATAADAKAAIFGAWRGILDGALSIGKVLEASPAGEKTVAPLYSPMGAIPDIRLRGGVLPTGQIARAPSRVIASIHTFFRAMNYSIEKNALIYRQGEGDAAKMAALRLNTPDDIMTASTSGATDLTLMGPAGQFVQHISKLTNWAPNLPGLGETPILKFIDPFVHIAANIIDQSIVQRTPAGLLSSEIRADLMGRNGVAAQDMAQARMIVGSALSIGFGALAAGGYVTGSGPMDRNKATMWRLAGYQAHSVRIGDTWYAMNRLGPLGMLLGTAADLYDVAHTASQGELLQAGAELQHAITQNVLDESFMRGPAELLQAIEDPGRYGERYIQNFASSFVPMSVGIAQMNRAADPYSRQARTVMDSIRQKIPGLSEQLFPRLDIWGQPIPNRDALVAAGLTAIYEQRMSQDPVNIALAAMGIGIAPVDRTIRNVKLTDQQYDDFARLAGRMTKQRLDVFVRSPDWQQWPVGVRVDAVKAIVDHSREAARGMMFMKYPSILADATRQKMQKKGLAP